MWSSEPEIMSSPVVETSLLYRSRASVRAVRVPVRNAIMSSLVKVWLTFSVAGKLLARVVKGPGA